jgi:DEAD/DEAH box helicase domain-containing protein
VGLEDVLNQFRTDSRWSNCVTAWKTVPARDAQFAPFPTALHPDLERALRERRFSGLYSHQAEAFELVEQGRNVAIVTPTASGKTLCYNLPVLNRMLREPNARAMYLFPTKALAQDQYAGLQDLIDATGADVKTYPYDGDTPAIERRLIRRAGNIVITNPDMLHSGILPHHTKWHELFENLQYIVIDEMHGYRGVFGSHVANVIRRLKRVCAHYGARPQFILASATIANPGHLAERIIEEPVTVIDRNGAPHGRREFIFYNPPVVNRALGIRRSLVQETTRLATELLRERVHTIVFARARVTAEVLLSYLREALPPGIGQSSAIRGYRGGYLPNQRREIERGLRSGEVLGVVSTNALELGVDIGSLDAVVMAGYPGTITSALQQSGRAGRRESVSAAILVASSAPLDQYIVNHPDYFFAASPEAGLVNPDNLLIVVEHIKCAAFELPFHQGDAFGAYPPVDALDYLTGVGLLHAHNGAWHWMSDSYPAAGISLRTTARENVVIVDRTMPGSPNIIGEVDAFSAPMLLHSNAIYLHEGQQFHVEELDWSDKKAYIHRVNADYYTDASLAVRVEVLDQFSDGGPAASRAHGEVLVSALVSMFKKIKMHTHENLGWGEVHLPEQQMHTTAYWLAAPPGVGGVSLPELPGALTGLANLIGNVAPLYLMCDPRDIGVYAQARSPFTGVPTVFIYDKVPGGVGFSERLYEIHGELLGAAYDLAGACPCADGCPSCVGVGPGEGEWVGKRTALSLLTALRGQTART